MEHEHEKEERSFIREHIVPRKNAKKVLLTILATVGLALLFGAIAGVSFYVSQNVMKANTQDTQQETEAPSIVPIGRDDEPTSASEQSKKPSIESESTVTEDGSEASEPATETTESETSKQTLKSVYHSLENGLLSLVISDQTGENLFGRPIVTKRNSFAVMIAETEGYVFCLFDGNGLTDDSNITATLQNKKVPCERLGIDKKTGLSVLRVPKSALTKDYTVIPLGSSLFVNASDHVFLIGVQQGEFPCMDEGIITHVTLYEDIVDGYQKRFYTNMHRESGTSSVLVNEAGEIIGWTSDYQSSSNGPSVVIGISSLKYLIEDLSSEMRTAYLGIIGRTLSTEEATDLGLTAGFYVREIEGNSPAAQCGMKVGDRLISVSGSTVSTSRELQNVVDSLIIGQEISVFVGRRVGDKEETIELVLRVGARP